MLHATNNWDEHDDHGPDIAPVCDVMIVKVAIFSLLAAGATVGAFRVSGVATSGRSTSNVTPIAEIRVDRSGGIYLSGHSIARNDLGAAIQERMKAETDPVVLIQTDDLLPSGESKAIRGIIQDAGCRPVEH